MKSQPFEDEIENIENKVILKHLLTLAVELSSERDTNRLLEHILQSAMELTNSEGGTIYSITADKELAFATLINFPLGLHLGGTSNKPINFPAIPIYKENGDVNEHALVAIAAAKGEAIIIDDVYKCDEYDLSAARAMDKKTGFHTQSVLAIALTNHENELNGVLQLINPRVKGQVVAFTEQYIELVCSISALAAVALTNRQLIDDMENLFQAFTQLIAKAIDEKSPYTGGHCRRVPVLTMMIAEAVHKASSGPYASFKMSHDDRHELSLAGWLHDCGKIAIPEYIMDKATKLQTVHDRIELVNARFEIAKRDLQIALLMCKDTAKRQQLESQLKQLESDRAFLQHSNIGGEFMCPEAQKRVADIAKNHQVDIQGQVMDILTENEVYNLSIARGTLTPEERKVINKHMDITIEMLEALPFPKHLQNVPEFAGGHHETMDGKGYPKGLTKEQMSVPARMMAIADIFEALTAADRPYKPAKPLSECLLIMKKMCENNHIDKDLYVVFIESKVYLEYAKQHLKPQQIDEVDHAFILDFK